MPTTTSDIAKYLYPGLKSLFNTSYKDYPMQCTQIFDEVSSNKAYEERAGFVGLGLSRVKGEGAPIYYDKWNQGFVRRSTNVSYALGYVVTREAVDDNQYMEATRAKTKALARSEAQAKEINGANLLNRAFNSSYTYVDGLELCSTAHLTKTGLTFANELATAADLSEAAIEQALIDIADFTDERGLKIAVQGKALVVPNELQFESSRILRSDLQSGSANNDINALKSLNMPIIVNNYLTDSDAWFIKTDVPEGMILQNRQSPEFENDTDFNSKNLLFTVYSRYVFDCVDVRSIFGSPGA
jgi:hypothetical protein